MLCPVDSRVRESPRAGSVLAGCLLQPQPRPREGQQLSRSVTSLRTYLQLAPNSGDAPAVTSVINFKAAQVLTDSDVVRVIASLTDGSGWKPTAFTNASGSTAASVSFCHLGGQRCAALRLPGGYRGRTRRDTAQLNGKTVEFGAFYCQCKGSTEILCRGAPALSPSDFS